jgi:hypothetical protein
MDGGRIATGNSAVRVCWVSASGAPSTSSAKDSGVVTMPPRIKVPAIVWTLGDREQATTSGVTRESRPIYYRPKDTERLERAGWIDPDYAEPLMAALSKITRR